MAIIEVTEEIDEVLREAWTAARYASSTSKQFRWDILDTDEKFFAALRNWCEDLVPLTDAQFVEFRQEITDGIRCPDCYVRTETGGVHCENCQDAWDRYHQDEAFDRARKGE